MQRDLGMLYVLYADMCLCERLELLEAYAVMWFLELFIYDLYWGTFWRKATWDETLSLASHRAIPERYQAITKALQQTFLLKNKWKSFGKLWEEINFWGYIELSFTYMIRLCQVSSCCEVLAVLSFAYSWLFWFCLLYLRWVS